MANKKISELTELAAAPAANDVLAIVDTSATETKKITPANLHDGYVTDGELTTHEADTSTHGVTEIDGVTERDAAISTHNSDTTAVHGISDTSALATGSDISTHAALDTGVHGAGINTLATDADITTHAAVTTSVHGITDTSDLGLKSGNVNQFADITSAGADIESAVSLKHAESHSVASHSDTSGTGAELDELTDGSTTTLHNHADQGTTDDYSGISANDVATDVTGAELEELSDGSQTTLHSHADQGTSDDYSGISANDAATDVTGAELEELTDGSETTLHSHAGGADSEKVKVDTGATADFIGAAANDGVLRVTLTDGITYTDGGDYVTIGLDVNYADVSGNDAGTDVTAAELEELSDGSQTTLHSHADQGTTDDYSGISANDAATDVTGAQLEELTDGSETTLHSHADQGTTDDYSGISANDAATDVTGAELETLTDGSDADSLHIHGNLTIDSTPDSDNTAEGIKTSLTAGENIAFPQVCYQNADGEIYLADADQAGEYPVICMALESKSDGQACSVLTYGIARDDDWTWTVGGMIYLDDATPGGMTQTAPSDDGDQIQILGIAIHADRMIFNPQLVIVEHA